MLQLPFMVVPQLLGLNQRLIMMAQIQVLAKLLA